MIGAPVTSLEPAAGVHVLTLLIGLILGELLAHAGNETLVDPFDTTGRRTGSALVDQVTGHVDFFDTKGRRTGWGHLDSSSKGEQFGRDGPSGAPSRQSSRSLPKHETRDNRAELAGLGHRCVDLRSRVCTHRRHKNSARGSASQRLGNGNQCGLAAGDVCCDPLVLGGIPGDASSDSEANRDRSRFDRCW